MADVNPIQGPMGPKEDPHKRDLKKMGTPEKFKETYRVQAIGEADAEAKKKRKRQEEAPETGTGLDGEVQPTTKQSLEPSPFEVQKPESKVSAASPSTSAEPPSGSYYMPSGAAEGSGADAEALPTPATAQPQQPEAAQPPPPVQSPSSTEQEEPSQPQVATAPAVSFSEDDLFSDEDDESYDMDGQPQEPTAAATPSAPQEGQAPTTTQGAQQAKPVAPKQEAIKTEGAKVTGMPAPEVKGLGAEKMAPGQAALDMQKPLLAPNEKKEGKDKGGEATTKEPKGAETEEKTIAIEPPSSKAEAPRGQESQIPSPPMQEEQQAAQQPALPLPPPPLSKESKGKDLSAEETALSWKEESQPVSAVSSESTGGDKEGHKEKKDEEPSMQISPITADVAPFAPQATAVSQTPMPSYTSFSPALLEMFDKMVGTISVLQESSGERKTTITLTSENFSSSPFYGAEIVIEEDLHLAPGQYNIKLIGSPEATALFQAKTDDLLAAFQSGNYNFKVQRIETVIQSAEKHLFQRKEKVGGDADKDMGGGEKQ